MPSVTRLRLAIQCHWNGTQQNLAVRCRMRNPTLTNYVRGQIRMLPEHRAILAHVLQVEPYELEGWISGAELWAKLGDTSSSAVLEDGVSHGR